MKETKSLSETALNDYIKANRKFEKKGKGGSKGKAPLRATKKVPQRPGKAADSKPKAPQQKPQTKLEIKNCHVDVSNKEIYELFAKFGTLTKCKLLTDDIGRSKGIAIVEFENAEHAKKAIEEYNDKEVRGSKLEVKYPVKKPKADTDRTKKITKEKKRPQPAAKGGRKRIDSGDSYDRDERRPRGRGNKRDRSNSDGDRRSYGGRNDRNRNDRNDRSDRNERRGGRNDKGRKNSNEFSRRRSNRRY